MGGGETDTHRDHNNDDNDNPYSANITMLQRRDHSAFNNSTSNKNDKKSKTALLHSYNPPKF